MVMQQTWQEGMVVDNRNAFIMWLKHDLNTRYHPTDEAPDELLRLIDQMFMQD